MKPYHNDMQVIRDRQRQLMEAADHYRLLQIAQMYRPGLSARLLAGLGGWMIAGGTRLKERYTKVASYQLPVASRNEVIGNW